MNALRYFLTIIIPPLIILSNFIFLALNSSFYREIQKEAGVYENFESQSIVDDQTNSLIGYFRGKNELEHNFFSSQAILHLKDVKSLLNSAAGLLILFSTTTFSLLVFLALKKEYSHILSALFISSVLTIFYLSLLSLGVFNYFDSFFKGFHKALFTNDLYLFEEGDSLIKLFPQQFFILFSKALFINTLITSTVLLLLSAVAKKLNHAS